MTTHPAQRILVTKSGFDDIGAILKTMGEGYCFGTVGLGSLTDIERLKDCEVLFINCSARCALPFFRPDPAVLRQFVERGGSIYASDWAATIVDRSFPDVLHFESTGKTEERECRVVDPGLREVIGNSLRVHFEMPGWYRVVGRTEGVRTYLESPDGTPLVVGFDHGAGHVLFTSFHNESQTSEAERKLLEYLVLRPVLARAMTGARHLIEVERCTPGREVIGTLARAAPGRAYEFVGAGVGEVLFLLHWNGATHLRMTVTDPAGRIRLDQAGPSPLRFTAPATRGAWRCDVTGPSLPHDNFPFVLTIATRNGTVGTPTPGSRHTTAGSPGPHQSWEISLLIDCSARAADFAPVIGQGLSILLRNLRGVNCSRVTPSVVVVPWRTTVAPAAHISLAAMSPVNLECRGDLSVASGFDWLRGSIRSRSADSAGKPMVVLVLASEPSDAAAVTLRGIHPELGTASANIVAVGIGPSPQAATLRAIAPLSLRVPSGSSGQVTACFQWLSELGIASIRSLEGSGGAFTAPPLPPGVERA